eukprot:747211-Hanusia_phi.AAC.2
MTTPIQGLPALLPASTHTTHTTHGMPVDHPPMVPPGMAPVLSPFQRGKDISVPLPPTQNLPHPQRCQILVDDNRGGPSSMITGLRIQILVGMVLACYLFLAPSYGQERTPRLAPPGASDALRQATTLGPRLARSS